MKKLFYLMGLFILTNLALVSADMSDIIESIKPSGTLIIILLVVVAIIISFLIIKNKPKNGKSPNKKKIFPIKKQGEVIPALLNYISKAKEFGINDEDIRKNLLAVKWSKKDIDKTLESVNKL